MSTSYKRISDIKDYDDPEAIEIRVIKKWTPDLQNIDFRYMFVHVHGHAIEGVALLADESYFDSKITIQSCYIVDKYIALPQIPHNPTVPHKASLRIGEKQPLYAPQTTRFPIITTTLLPTMI